MTIRLYYADSYTTSFTGMVRESTDLAGDPAVVLDRTVFYPTSGGQPFDTGTLATARVLNVEEDSSGRILHILDSPLQLGPVSGVIDWNRRFDHMQQHTGQHILSQAFVQVAAAPTISFHLGVETCTIDLELTSPSPSIMQQAEELASRIVFEDRPVHILTVRREDRVNLGLRKSSEREGEIRVIDVEGFDQSPCGGTHVRRSGEIGIISVLDYERYKGGTRVEFVCGGRALKTLRRDHDTLRHLGKLYSGHLYELPRLAEKFFEERVALARENSKLGAQILEMEAQELIAQAVKNTGFFVVRRDFTNRSLESVKTLAQKVVSRGRGLALLALVHETAQVVLARSAGLIVDCAQAVKEVSGKHGGKGGGRPELAQAGGIPPHSLDEWLREAENWCRNHLRRETQADAD